MGCREGFWEMMEPELGPKREKKKKEERRGKKVFFFEKNKRQNWERNKPLK